MFKAICKQEKAISGQKITDLQNLAQLLYFFSYILNTSFIHKNTFFLLTFVIPKEYEINLKCNKAELLQMPVYYFGQNFR